MAKIKLYLYFAFINIHKILTSSEQYFSYIQDENMFNNIHKLCRNEGIKVSTRQRLLTVTEKELQGGKIQSIAAATMLLLFFKIYTKEVFRVEGMWHPKNVANYGPRSGFPYYNLITIWKGLPYPLPGDALISSVSLSHQNLP